MDERLARIQSLCGQVKDEFLAKLAVVVRNEFHLRSIGHVLLGELSNEHKGDDLVKRVLERVAIRPDDISEIIGYVELPLPKQVKRGIRHALLKFSRYQLAKYKGEGKDVSLVHHLVHPNPKLRIENKRRPGRT